MVSPSRMRRSSRRTRPEGCAASRRAALLGPASIRPCRKWPPHPARRYHGDPIPPAAMPMSVTYAIHLPLRALPDSGWLAASVRGMAPTFAWVADYDLAHDIGWCPCQLDGAECGFDWDLDREPTLSPTDARRYDVTAQVSHGASSQEWGQVNFIET